jgi:hypothetical protein
VTCIAVPVMRRKSAEPARFRIPLGWLIPVAGILLCVWLFAQAPNDSKVAFLLACAVGAGLYVFRRTGENKP